MPRRRAVMFDLDGTLADTLRDIADAANWALATLGRPPRPLADYRYLAGQGVDHLIAEALGPSHHHLHADARRLYLDRYDAHKYDHTGPFPGMPELLDALTDQGVVLAVVSNKPHDATRQVVADLFGRWPFAAVYGARPGVPLKPDPAAALAICDELRLPPSEWLYVGDTRADMLTGRAAGMTTVGVLWGFRDEPELRDSGAHAIIRRPDELLPLLDHPD